MKQLDMKKVRPLIRMAMEEDLGPGDVTTDLLFTDGTRAKATVVTREEIVVAGLPIVEEILHQYDERLKMTAHYRDGQSAHVGAKLATIEGPLRPAAELDQEIENLIGVVGREVVDQREGVEVDLVSFAAFDGAHDAVPRAVAAEVEAIVVVQLLRAIDADADQEFVLVQEFAPVGIVQEDRIRLERISDLLAGDAVLLLQLHRPFVEVHAHQCRLAPLPGKPRQLKSQAHVILHEPFEHGVAHALASRADLSGAALVEAVPAIDVAVGTRGFNQKCKRLCHIGYQHSPVCVLSS